MSEWKLTSAFVTGLSHLQEGTPCQDKISVTPEQSGVPYHAAALADGVGSLMYSHIAAKLATDTALEWMIESRDELFDELGERALEKKRLKDLGARMVKTIRKAIEEQANLHSIDLRTMDCNLAFCFVDEQYGKAFVGQLGDCAVCIVHNEMERRQSWVMSEQGTLANSTDTVFSRNSEDRVNVKIVSLQSEDHDGSLKDSAVCGFILTSDGLENVLYRKGSRCVCKQAEYCFNLGSGTVDKRSGALRELLTDAQQKSRGYLNDDMSIVVFSRASGDITLMEEPQWICTNCGAENLVTEMRCHNCSADLYSMYPKADIEAQGGADVYFEKQRIRNRNNAADQKEKEEPVTRQEKSRKQESRNKATRKNPQGTMELSETPAEEELRKVHGPRSLDKLGKLLKTNDTPASEEAAEEEESELADNRTSRRRDPPQQTQRLSAGTIVLLAIAMTATIALIGVLLFWGVKAMNSRNDPPSTGPSENVGQTTDPDDPGNQGGSNTPMRPSGEGVLLEDGSVFFGPVLLGKPDGYGTLIRDTTVWTGRFILGVKDGIFTVTSYKEDEIVASVVLYENDVVRQTYYGEMETIIEPVCVMKYKTRLYATPDYNGEPLLDANNNVVYVMADERIYPTGAESLSESGIKWRQIRTESGITGWCEESAIIRVVADTPSYDQESEAANEG